MFNIGGGEMVVIFILALVVLGPDKLPNAARQAGKYLSEFRRMSQGFQQELKDAMDIPELNDLKATLTAPLSTTTATSTPPVATTEAAPSDNGSDSSSTSTSTSDSAVGTEGSNTGAVTQLDPPPHIETPSRPDPAASPSIASVVVEGPSGSFT